MTIQSAQQDLLAELKKLYDNREAANIADWVMEHITGRKKISRLLDKQQILVNEQITQLNTILAELATHKPVQYVLGEAWFAGMKFYVNEHTLIPRPETEELVDWIVNSKVESQNLLDIGAGSGCVAIAVKKKLPNLLVTSIDVSKEALEVAKQNANALEAAIDFLLIDFLDDTNWERLPQFDIIVSNPPYIPQSAKAGMDKHVRYFEPAPALFVPDEDPLLFYRKIAAFGKTNLSKGGSMFLEINETLGKEVVTLYEETGYQVTLKKDLQGKDRMVKVYY